MAVLTKQYTFTANTKSKSAEVNTNFDQIVSFINTNMMQKDGSTAFTGYPLLPGSSPSNALHAASKGYVDAAVPKLKMGTFTGSTDAFGQVSVAHGLGAVVTGAIAGINGNVTLFGGAALTAKITAGDSSTVTFKFWNGVTAYASAAIKFHWIAWV